MWISLQYKTWGSIKQKKKKYSSKLMYEHDEACNGEITFILS